MKINIDIPKNTPIKIGAVPITNLSQYKNLYIKKKLPEINNAKQKTCLALH